MSGSKEELTRHWMIKAERDLRSARELAEADEPLLARKGAKFAKKFI